MRLRPELRPDPTGGAHCAPQTSYLVYGEEWKGRVEDGTENCVGGTELGQHPHPLFTFPGNVWIRQLGGETLEDHLRFFPWRFESLLYEGIIYVLYV